MNYRQYFTHDLINYKYKYNYNYNIISILKRVAGLSYYEDLNRDQIVFSISQSSLKTKIEYPGEGYNFRDLVKTSNLESDLAFSRSFNNLVGILLN